jgi:hypothetical protein
MRNHLIIGLGGTGGKVIRALRKTVFQEFRSNDPEIVNLRYLYVDSSREMMGLNDATWKTLGESVQLDPRSQLLIGGGDLNQILKNLDNFPNIKPWIGSREQWTDILNSIVGETLGGQKRRLGRFLFACRTRDFKLQLNQLAGEITTGGEQELTFHICCGLAGGTGGGSVIDVISQVRNLYRDSKKYRVVVYVLLPDEFPAENWDTGNYHANGYAALLEINALSVNNLRPHDLGDRGDRLMLSDPFNGCYLFTNHNENGLKVDLDKELPNIVADFLFQKVLAIRHVGAQQIIQRIENAENGDGTPETRAGQKSIPERSKRFLTFGIKRLAIPEIEIREYLSYKFARQAALQLRFNNWDDVFGFREEPRTQDFGEIVRQKETQERWMIGDDHVTLSRGILLEEVNNKKWKPLNREWMEVIPEFVTMAKSNKDASDWLNDLERLSAQRFDETFRGLGVRKFYETKLAARKDHVREIRRKLEAELFEEWRTGVKSMHDISRELDALLLALDERLANSETKQVRAKENEALAQKKVEANRREWRHVGFIGKVFGKYDTILNAHSECLRDLYIYRTYIEAWGFAKRLLEELKTEVTRFSTDVAESAGLVDDANKEFQVRINERCNDTDKPDLRQSLVRYYNPSKVKEFAKELEKDKLEQTRQAQGVRLGLIEQLGGELDFLAFHTRISKQRFFDVMEQKCEASSKAAHDRLVSTSRDLSPLFGVNIIGKLEREFSGRDEDLKSFIHDLVSRAGNFLEFDNQEVNRAGPGIPAGVPTKVTQFMTIIPKSPENAAFATKLKEVIKSQFRGGIPVEVIESDGKLNEILLIGLTNLFPLRYAKLLRFLKERYDVRLAQTDKPDRVRLELHLEGDGTQFPELFVPDRDLVIGKALPFVILAKVLGIVQPITSPTTGSTELYLIEVDEDGLDKHTKLGRNLPDLVENLDVLAAQRFEDSVQSVLMTPEYQHQDKRSAVQAQIRSELRAVLNDRRGDIEDSIYKRFESAARKALQILKAP